MRLPARKDWQRRRPELHGLWKMGKKYQKLASPVRLLSGSSAAYMSQTIQALCVKSSLEHRLRAALL